ncbi:hypothetical protein PMAYCL1PPCAC_08681, partial [Pristionchus mayeri]
KQSFQAAASINRNLFIIIINGVTSMVTLLGLSLCIFISVRVFRHQIFHINQRILLVLIGTLLSVRATFSLYKGGWFLQRLLYITVVNTAYIFACHHFPSGFFHPPPLTVNSTFVVFCTSVSYPQIRWVSGDQNQCLRLIYILFNDNYNSYLMLNKFQSARIVYPNMICFTVLYTVCCSCTTLTAYLQTDGHQVELAVIIKEFGSLAFNVHIIAHPLILIWKEPTLWKNEQRIIEDPALALDAAKHFNKIK